MRAKRPLWIAIILCSCFLMGCQSISFEEASIEQVAKSDNSEADKEMEPVTLGLEPEFTYPVIPMKPSVKLNQAGYTPTGTKWVVFEGENLADTFEVIKKDTGEIVFEGVIERRKESGEQTISYGDFSELTEPGIYYIRTDVIGYSYPFCIQEGIFENMFGEAMKQFYYSRCGTSLAEEYAGEEARNACHTSFAKLQEDMKVEADVTGGWHTDSNGNRSVVIGCNAMQRLLLAYEIGGEMFGDEGDIPESGDLIPDLLNELQYEAAWLLKMQDPATGGVYDGVRTTEYSNGTTYSYVQATTVDASLRFAATMAKFSYLYKNQNTEFATICLRAADRALRYSKHYPDQLNDSLLFDAVVELYRATGYLNYRNDVDAFLLSHDAFDMSDEATFLGCVTYLFSKQRVNTSYCEMMISGLMKYVENLSYAGRNAAYFVEDEMPSDLSDMLKDTSRIAVVNYVITNNEYDRLLHNYINYFLGCNSQAVCYVGQYGVNNAVELSGSASIMNQAENDACWILLLSSVLEKPEME